MLLGHDCSPSQPESLTTASDSLSEVFMEPLLMDEPSSSYEPVEFNFEFSDHNYRLAHICILFYIPDLMGTLKAFRTCTSLHPLCVDYFVYFFL